MNEAEYSRSLKAALMEGRPDVYVWKIHDQFSNGVPDCFIEGPHRDLWLEVKYLARLPKLGSTLIDPCKLLSQLQINWLKRRYSIRDDTAVLLGSSEGSVILWGNSWMNPLSTSTFRNSAMPKKQLIAAIHSYISGH